MQFEEFEVLRLAQFQIFGPDPDTLLILYK